MKGAIHQIPKRPAEEIVLAAAAVGEALRSTVDSDDGVIEERSKTGAYFSPLRQTRTIVPSRSA